MAQRKLGRTADQRKALIRNQVTNLIWYGRIETTEARAKEVRRAAERLITLAVNECGNTLETTKQTHNDKGQIVTLNVVNDAPSRLAARRIMLSYLYELKDHAQKGRGQGRLQRAHRAASSTPWWRSSCASMAPSSRSATKRKKCAGGYTRIFKLGPRRGDAAEMCLIEIV